MQHTEILPGIEIIGLTLYLSEENVLVFGDLHLGYEEELNKGGFLVPRFQYDCIIEHLEKIFLEIHPETAVINGDLKHEFGTISGQEWREVMNFLDFLEKNVENIILVKGNHDTILGPIAGKKGVEIAPHYFFNGGKIYITHGHEMPKDEDFKNSKIMIIGHDHPAIALREDLRIEKIKCFLKGPRNNKVLIQIPSLNFISEGFDITQNRSLSPLMSQNSGNFEVFGVEDSKIFHFGRLKDL